jgi:N-acetylmuramoyl-L-alanine amidase
VLLLLAWGIPAAASKPGASGFGHETGRGPDGYVPAPAFIERFNLDFSFDAATGTLTVGRGRRSLVFVAGSRQVFGEGRISWLSAPVELREGCLMVPRDGVDLVSVRLLNGRAGVSHRGGGFEAETGSGPREQQRIAKTAPGAADIDAIIIDAGHGGSDPGGIGYGGVKEKDIVLDVALELKREIMKRYRQKEIVVTRDSDTFVSLEGRGGIANGVSPDRNAVFISIHANASFEKGTYGFETYFLSLDPASEDARDVARMENAVFTKEIESYSDNIQRIMNRIVDVEYRRESVKLAEAIQRRLSGSIGNSSNDRGIKSAFFYVLKAAKMPSVLVEIGFVTNKDESERLLQPDYRKRIARGIAEGLDDFITLFQRTEGFTKTY